MTGQMFKDIVEGICAMRNIKKTIVARQMKVSKPTLNKYEREGVPIAKIPLVMDRLKYFILV